MKHENFSLRDFSIRNINVDGVGRFGIVWNNTNGILEQVQYYIHIITVKNSFPLIISLEV